MCSSVVVSLMLVYIRISEVIIKKLYSYGFYPGSELVSSFSWLILHHCCDSSLILVSSVQFSHSVVSNSLQPHGLQHTRLPCPSLSSRVCSNSCPSSRWCHPTISFSVVPFSSCLQSFPTSWSFPMSQLFSSGGQSTGASASASVLPMNIQGWFPLVLTGLIPLQFKGLSSIFSSSTVWKNTLLPFKIMVRKNPWAENIFIMHC